MADRVVVVGGGFAGLSVVRRLEKRMPGADLRLVTPDDYALYLPLLPQVAAGVLPPRSVIVPLVRALRRAVLVPGRAIGVDLDARRVATRQAPVAAHNVVAGLRGESLRTYRHRDLGLVVDLGVDLAGRAAQLVTRGYHLWAVGAPDTMRRVATNWAVHRSGAANAVRLGLGTVTSARLAAFESTADALTPDQASACTSDIDDRASGLGRAGTSAITL